MIDKSDIEQWKHNPVTVAFLAKLIEIRDGSVESLTHDLNYSQPNIMLQIGRLLGSINTLTDIIESNVLNLYEDVDNS